MMHTLIKRPHPSSLGTLYGSPNIWGEVEVEGTHVSSARSPLIPLLEDGREEVLWLH